MLCAKEIKDKTKVIKLVRQNIKYWKSFHGEKFRMLPVVYWRTRYSRHRTSQRSATNFSV